MHLCEKGQRQQSQSPFSPCDLNTGMLLKETGAAVSQRETVSEGLTVGGWGGGGVAAQKSFTGLK